MKALGAIVPSIVSRQVYYPGAKHLVPVLQLLVPGIDLVSWVCVPVCDICLSPFRRMTHPKRLTLPLSNYSTPY